MVVQMITPLNGYKSPMRCGNSTCKQCPTFTINLGFYWSHCKCGTGTPCDTKGESIKKWNGGEYL